MANGRNDRSKIDNGRDPGRFIGLPVSVLESVAYLGLSASARSLLLEVALQFHGDDNGKMLLSRAHLNKRGWASNDMINKGKRELLNAELIFETVKGHRPNKASWYAVTWRRLDRLPGFDHGAEKAFRRGAYRTTFALEPPIKNAALTPQGGTRGHRIAPPHGTEAPLPVPQGGPMRTLSAPRPVPPYGHPLEKPSPRAVSAPARMIALLFRTRTRPGTTTLPVAYHAARTRLNIPK